MLGTVLVCDPAQSASRVKLGTQEQNAGCFVQERWTLAPATECPHALQELEC